MLDFTWTIDVVFIVAKKVVGKCYFSSLKLLFLLLIQGELSFPSDIVQFQL